MSQLGKHKALAIGLLTAKAATPSTPFPLAEEATASLTKQQSPQGKEDAGALTNLGEP